MSSRVLLRSAFGCARSLLSVRLLVALAVGLFLSTSVASAAYRGGASSRRARIGQRVRAHAVSRAAAPAAVPAPAGAPSYVGAELPAQRTADSRTYLNKRGGGYVQFISAAPLHYRDAQGVWQPIDDSLVPSGGGYTNAANSYRVSLPASLRSPLQFSDGDASVSMSLVGGGGSVAASGATATYTSALPGVSVRYAAGPESVELTRSC
jgi:hypothetical protein